ncbi:MAG TPA: YtxH domain-containing protein [Polyangia bacterium]|nr:YtxH domain-containing protein [Polyangia bacterium]
MNLKDLNNLDQDHVKDRLLEMMGVEAKRSTGSWLFGTLTAFGVGMLVGAGVGLILAPKAGAGLREDLRDRLRSASHRLDHLRDDPSANPQTAGA